MPNHYAGPDFGCPPGDARLDLTDLYAFPKPSEADKSILIMNVHPSAAVNPAGSTTREPFAPKALYELRIDTNGVPSPTSHIGCASRPPRTGRKPRPCGASRVRRPPKRVTAARS